MKAKLQGVRYTIRPHDVCGHYAHGESVVLRRGGRVIFDTKDYPCKGERLDAPPMPLPQPGDVLDVYTDCNHLRIHVERVHLDNGRIVVEGTTEYDGAWAGFGRAWCAAEPLDEAPFRAAVIESSYGRLTWAQRDALGRLMVLAAFGHGDYWYSEQIYLPYGKSALGRILWGAVQNGNPQEVAAALGFIIAERQREGGPREDAAVERVWKTADKGALARWAEEEMAGDAQDVAGVAGKYMDGIAALVRVFTQGEGGMNDMKRILAAVRAAHGDLLPSIRGGDELLGLVEAAAEGDVDRFRRLLLEMLAVARAVEWVEWTRRSRGEEEVEVGDAYVTDIAGTGDEVVAVVVVDNQVLKIPVADLYSTICGGVL